jgi:allantoicase
VLPIVPLMPGHEGTRHHAFVVPDEAVSRMEAMGGVTHPRLNYFPNGGVARMRAYGRPVQRAAAAAVGG